MSNKNLQARHIVAPRKGFSEEVIFEERNTPQYTPQNRVSVPISKRESFGVVAVRVHV